MTQYNIGFGILPEGFPPSYYFPNLLLILVTPGLTSTLLALHIFLHEYIRYGLVIILVIIAHFTPSPMLCTSLDGHFVFQLFQLVGMTGCRDPCTLNAMKVRHGILIYFWVSLVLQMKCHWRIICTGIELVFVRHADQNMDSFLNFKLSTPCIHALRYFFRKIHLQV